MKLALFGDLHGRVLLPFYLMDRWQQEHGEAIEYALCTGDVGVYRGLHSMEPTSRRWAERYPEELGFCRFLLHTDDAGRFSPHPGAEELLSRVRADLYFVPGNHEDHDYLEQLWRHYASSLEEPVAVDLDWPGLAEGAYQQQDFCGHGRLRCLPQGRRTTLPGPLDEQTWEPAYELGLMAITGLHRYTPREAWAARATEPVDVLLTHGTYMGRIQRRDRDGRLKDIGSTRLRELIRRVGPAAHFFGHHHRSYPEEGLSNHQGGVTRSVGLNQVFFESPHAPLTRGCFGILDVDGPGRLRYHEVTDPWLQDLRGSHCERYL